MAENNQSESKLILPTGNGELVVTGGKLVTPDTAPGMTETASGLVVPEHATTDQKLILPDQPQA